VIFCFRSKRADRVKLIFWDGTGLCLFAKRLEKGKFQWPRIEDGVMRLSGPLNWARFSKVLIGSACMFRGSRAAICAIACGELNRAAKKPSQQAIFVFQFVHGFGF